MFGSSRKLVSWPNRLFRPEYQTTRARNFLRFILEIIDKQDLNNAKTLNNMSRLALKILKKSPYAEKSKIRLVLTRLFPWDPLIKEKQSPIDVYILTHEKDIDILPYSIIGATEAVKSNLKNVYVVAPKQSEKRIKAIIEILYTEANYISDEEILNNYLGNLWTSFPAVPKMEILKICCALNSPTGTALIIDGDTVLLRSRVWSASNQQIAIVAQEYLRRHINFNKNKMGIDPKTGIGFVSHHGVVIKSILTDSISNNGGIGPFSSKFAESYKEFKNPQDDFPSEWQLISDLNISKNPYGTKLSKFSNYGISRNSTKFQLNHDARLNEVRNVIDSIRKECPKLGSISFHGYK